MSKYNLIGNLKDRFSLKETHIKVLTQVEHTSCQSAVSARHWARTSSLSDISVSAVSCDCLSTNGCSLAYQELSSSSCRLL